MLIKKRERKRTSRKSWKRGYLKVKLRRLRLRKWKRRLIWWLEKTSIFHSLMETILKDKERRWGRKWRMTSWGDREPCPQQLIMALMRLGQDLLARANDQIHPQWIRLFMIATRLGVISLKNLGLSSCRNTQPSWSLTKLLEQEKQIRVSSQTLSWMQETGLNSNYFPRSKRMPRISKK